MRRQDIMLRRIRWVVQWARQKSRKIQTFHVLLVCLVILSVFATGHLYSVLSGGGGDNGLPYKLIDSDLSVNDVQMIQGMEVREADRRAKVRDVTVAPTAVALLLTSQAKVPEGDVAEMRAPSAIDAEPVEVILGISDSFDESRMKHPDRDSTMTNGGVWVKDDAFEVFPTFVKGDGKGLGHVGSPLTIYRLGDRPNNLNSKLSDADRAILTTDFDSSHKWADHVGDATCLKKFKQGTKFYNNCIAVVEGVDSTSWERRHHGALGVFNGKAMWKPRDKPVPIEEYPDGGKDNALKRGGGFYRELSDAMPINRWSPEDREPVCQNAPEKEMLDHSLYDASVVITFYNEPLSTLLRTVHSVLNQTPPHILKEILLVDDHSDIEEDLPGGPLYEYVKLLPKTHIIRLSHRKGLVHSRLAGAEHMTGDIFVVLDSHVEVQKGWLENQILRIQESPSSVVFPQILSLDSTNFDYLKDRGIGCYLSFKWTMTEQSSLTGKVESRDVINSNSMAGGLFAVLKSTFYDLGAYDEEFAMWGAENVEMGFRVLLCGGKLECTPCARTYHIYRQGGVGYSSPPDSVRRNQLRTAYLWTDEFFPLARHFLGLSKPFDIGPIDKMLKFKQAKQCKPFGEFLKTDKIQPIKSMADIEFIGPVASQKIPNLCIDTLSSKEDDEKFGLYYCHHQGGTQGLFKSARNGRLITTSSERRCFTNNGTVKKCENNDKDCDGWTLDYDKGQLSFSGSGLRAKKCLSIDPASQESPPHISMEPCNAEDANQLWKFQRYSKDDTYEPPVYDENKIPANHVLSPKLEM